VDLAFFCKPGGSPEHGAAYLLNFGLVSLVTVPTGVTHSASADRPHVAALACMLTEPASGDATSRPP
jgi:hypothetical protein